MDEIVFHKDLNLICWCPQGTLTAQHIINYFVHIKQVDWSYQANRFTNFSQISNFVLDYDQMKQVVFYRQMRLKEHVNIKSGLYCPSDVSYALARMYQMLMEDFKMYTFISRDVDEVAQFLNIPSEIAHKNLLFPN